MSAGYGFDEAWTFQDHRPDVEGEGDRVAQHAGRLAGESAYGIPTAEKVGPLQGAFVLDGQGDREGLPGWFFAVPAEIASRPSAPGRGGTRTRGQQQASSAASVRILLADGAVDPSFGPVPVSLPPGFENAATGTRGVLLAGSARNEQQLVFIPTGGQLVAPHAGSGEGTPVYDTDAEGRPDPDRVARIETGWRVIVPATGGPGKLGIVGDGKGDGYLVARSSGGGDPAPDLEPLDSGAEALPGTDADGLQVGGVTLVSDFVAGFEANLRAALAGGEPEPSGPEGDSPESGGSSYGESQTRPANELSSEVRDLEDPDDDGQDPADDEPPAAAGATLIAARLCSNQGGPIDVGSATDPHLDGEHLDGRTGPAHISTDALHRLDDRHDGPRDFDSADYEETDPAPFVTRAYERFDRSEQHDVKGGPAAGATRPGKWKIQAEALATRETIIIPPPPPPEPEPTEWIDGGDRNVGPRGPSGPNGDPPPGGDDDPPPPAPGVGGGIGGEAWNPFGPLGPQVSPFPEGAPEPKGDGSDGAPVGLDPPDELFGPDGDLTPGNGGANVTPKIPNPGGGYAASPLCWALGGLIGLANPTAVGEPNLGQARKLSPSDREAWSLAPYVGAFVAHAAGDGRAIGWDYAVRPRPGQRPSAVRAGFFLLPPGASLGAYRHPETIPHPNPTAPQTGLYFPPEVVGGIGGAVAGWGTPHETGGIASGVVIVQDGEAGDVGIYVVDANGQRADSPLISFGAETGVVVTDKLTVGGRLDPTTLEITSAASDPIPSAAQGFRYDSATSPRPLWREHSTDGDGDSHAAAYRSDFRRVVFSQRVAGNFVGFFSAGGTGTHTNLGTGRGRRMSVSAAAQFAFTETIEYWGGFESAGDPETVARIYLQANASDSVLWPRLQSPGTDYVGLFVDLTSDSTWTVEAEINGSPVSISTSWTVPVAGELQYLEIEATETETILRWAAAVDVNGDPVGTVEEEDGLAALVDVHRLRWEIEGTSATVNTLTCVLGEVHAQMPGAA